MSKNIVIFSDGTGQEGGVGNDSNIYKLFKAVENRTPHQIAFYDSGVGTGTSKIFGMISGTGISRNILECYRFIFDNFEADDQIYLFGFSRGAATVRSLSGFIHTFGVLPKSRPELIDRAYKIYKTRDDKKRQKKAESFCSRHHTMWTRIKFIGVWDTVAALGIPFPTLDKIVNLIPGFRHEFHDYSLSSGVDNAFQALAIDDQRRTFHPVLWDSKITDEQVMEQVWFLGMHTDVGGGYDETGLSDVPMHWLIEKAKQKDLLIYDKDILEFEGNPNGPMHNSRGNWLSKFYVKEPRSWPEKDSLGASRGEPQIHESVKERVLNVHNQPNTQYVSWISKYFQPRE